MQVDDRIEVVLGFIEVALDGFLVLLPEHLGTLAGAQELLVVSLQSFDDVAVLLRTHLGQLSSPRRRREVKQKTKKQQTR